MPAETLIGLVPDLVVLMRRDGHVLALGGGHAVPGLRPADDAAGESLEPAWSDATRTLVLQLVGRCISLRTTADARFHELGRHYEARATAQGPDCAVVLVRPVLVEPAEDTSDVTAERLRPQRARRTASSDVSFFRDTIKTRSLARFDMARELRDAISNREIGIRYVGRHDLKTGRMVCWVGYVRWEHRLRGEIRPAEFLPIAERTGLALPLSRAALDCFCNDFEKLRPRLKTDVRLSFGALCDHVFHEDFMSDMHGLIAEGRVPAERLELRIAEKAFIACDPDKVRPLRKSGVQLVVDEVGRDMGSLVALARAPLWGLQLDRSWTTAIRSDDVARLVCRAGLSVANALGFAPIASGIDSQTQRDSLLEIGFRYGTGDLYAAAAPDNLIAAIPA